MVEIEADQDIIDLQKSIAQLKSGNQSAIKHTIEDLTHSLAKFSTFAKNETEVQKTSLLLAKVSLELAKAVDGDHSKVSIPNEEIFSNTR